MLNDMEFLQRALEREKEKTAPRLGIDGSWEYFSLGASRDDTKRLLNQGLITIVHHNSECTKYRLTDKGKNLVFAVNVECEMKKIPASDILDAMSLIVGFDDVKSEIAYAI